MSSMEKQDLLHEFQKEFLEEIHEVKLDISSLKKAKVSEDILGAEIAIRKVFGDEIFEKNKIKDDIEGEKTVVKLTDSDISFDSEVQKICDELIDINFETGVNIILSKVAEDED